MSKDIFEEVRELGWRSNAVSISSQETQLDSEKLGIKFEFFHTFLASRSSLAIKPEWSTMSGFKQFQIRPGATLLEGGAAPKGPYLPGGQNQKFILDWRTDLLNP